MRPANPFCGRDWTTSVSARLLARRPADSHLSEIAADVLAGKHVERAWKQAYAQRLTDSARVNPTTGRYLRRRPSSGVLRFVNVIGQENQRRGLRQPLARIPSTLYAVTGRWNPLPLFGTRRSRTSRRNRAARSASGTAGSGMKRPDALKTPSAASACTCGLKLTRSPKVCTKR
jgi:hypothetical protein